MINIAACMFIFSGYASMMLFFLCCCDKEQRYIQYWIIEGSESLNAAFNFSMNTGLEEYEMLGDEVGLGDLTEQRVVNFSM